MIIIITLLIIWALLLTILFIIQNQEISNLKENIRELNCGRIMDDLTKRE